MTLPPILGTMAIVQTCASVSIFITTGTYLFFSPVRFESSARRLGWWSIRQTTRHAKSSCAGRRPTENTLKQQARNAREKGNVAKAGILVRRTL
ncbi:hypothetical protein GQ607_006224 [Colletotrichum asianum]|uniref:Uncharacterized protein n=1 Tax=Colletotrichum asianum TaxID=702518 RepID=A0A8H3ZUA1_9PEZI|nr:hypothetical protein GQ607_006224 [Colletotrichum asianum]